MLLQDSEIYDGVLAGVGSIFGTFRSSSCFHDGHNTRLPMHVRCADHDDVLGYGGNSSTGDIDAPDGIVPNFGSAGY